MSLSLVILIALQSAGAGEAGVETQGEPILVLGRKAQSWKGRIKYREDEGVLCSTRRSTKDAELDDLLCGSLRGCVEENFDDFLALRDRSRPRSERTALNAVYEDKMRACVRAERQGLLAGLAARRNQ